MNATSAPKKSRAVLALASLGFALGALMAPLSDAVAQRAPDVKAVAKKPGDARLAYGGDSCTWDGANGTWDTAARWSCGHVPRVDDLALIESGNVTFGAGIAVQELLMSGGFVEVASGTSMVGVFRQEGGTLVLRQDGRLAFPQGHPFQQSGGQLIVEIGGASRFGRMDFDNHIGGLGLFGLGGNLQLTGLNGYVPDESAQFLFMNGSSMSATSSGFIPTVQHVDFPSDFQPVLGLFSGVIRNIYPGACRYVGGFSLWSVASNWSCGHVPTASDTVILEGAQVGLEIADETVARLVLKGSSNSIRGPGGHTLTALGQPQPNELIGNVDVTQELKLVLGDSRATGALAFSLYSTSSIENQGRFEVHLPGDSFSVAGGVVRNAPGSVMDLLVGSATLYGDLTLVNEGEISLRGSDPSTVDGLARMYLQAPARLRQVAGRFTFTGAVAEYSEGTVFELEGGELAGDNARLDMPVVNTGGIVRPGMPASCGGGGEAFARASTRNATGGPTPDGCSASGRLEVLGYTQGPGGTLEFQFGDNGDEFAVNGPVNLDGTLLLRDYDGYRPRFDINLFLGFPVSGFFHTVDSDMPTDYSVAVAPPRTVYLKYSPSSPVAAPAFTNAPPFFGGRVGEPFTYTFTATGSPAPTFSLASGNMPPGLTLAPDGVLSGTPMATVGTYEFTVSASNGVPPAASQPANFELTHGWAATIQVEGGNLQSATTNHAFGVPLRLAVRDVASNPVPLVAVDYVVPAAGASATLSSYSEATGPDGSVTVLATANAVAGSYAITATTPGLAEAAVFNLTNVATSRPALFGLTFPSAINYGTKFQFTASVRDAGTAEPVAAGTVRVFVGGSQVCAAVLPDVRCFVTGAIEPGVPLVHATLDSPTHSANAFESTIFVGAHTGSIALTAPASVASPNPIDVTAKLQYLAASEELFGDTVMPTGSIVVRKDGTPVCSAPATAPGSQLACSVPSGAAAFTLSAEYAGDAHWKPVTASQAVTVTTPPPPAVKPAFTSSAPPAGTLGLAYSHTFTASGTSPIVFSIGQGSLPPGLSLTNDGMLTGMPATPGTFAFKAAATNAAGSATQDVVIVIVPPAQTRVEIAGGNRQTAFYNRARLTGDAFAVPLRVRVVDPAGQGIAGQRVEFVSMGRLSGAAARATLSAQSVVTDAKGEAQVIATADNGLGTHQVRALVVGLEPVFFDLTNVAAVLGKLRLVSPDVRGTIVRRTPLLAPFPALKVKVESADDRRALAPGREVRFYVPWEAGGTKASAVVEGVSSGRLAAAETPRPDDGFYRLYATAITGSDSIAQVDAFANGVAGAYDVIAVLVEEGVPVDPQLAPADKRFAIPLENQDVSLSIQVRPGTLQRAQPGAAFLGPNSATLFITSSGACCGGISASELWVFAGDDARGEPGATILGDTAIEGRLPGGERYTAITTDIHGIARFSAVANRYQGRHEVTVAYPGSYDTLAKAKVKASAPFDNLGGVPPAGGGTGEGAPAASLEIVSGDFQRSAAVDRRALAFPLVVRALGAAGTPLANVLVRFVPIATVVSSGRTQGNASVILSDSSVMTDSKGQAQVTAVADGDINATVMVRASAEGADPVSFTVRLTNAIGSTQPSEVRPIARQVNRTTDGILGQDQPQVIFARFDEPLSVKVVSVTSGLVQVGAAVRFYFPPATAKDGSSAATFEPEVGTPGTFVNAGGQRLPYVSVLTDNQGVARITGLANGIAGRYDVIALAADPSPDDDNDPVEALRKGERAYAFHLENAPPGATLEVVQGNAQSAELNQVYVRALQVHATATKPDPHVAPGAQKGLDGAELWFMWPEIVDDHTPAVALVTGESHAMLDPKGNPWRVVAVPIAVETGIAETAAVANGVAGFHRIIVAYPGNFTDPASAPGSVVISLCNGQPRSQSCRDPETTAGSVELVDAAPFFTLTQTPPPLRVRVKNMRGALMANATVGFTSTSAGIAGSGAWSKSGAVWNAAFTTNASGIADAAPGLTLGTASLEYVVTASAGVGQAQFVITRYAAPSTIAPVGPIASGVPINTVHRALQVSTPARAPIEWAVVPGPNGASATFAGGVLVARDIGPVSRASNTLYTAPTLTANGIAGNFTLKATIIGTTIGTTFAMGNFASAPATIARADEGGLFTNTTAAPPLRFIVRDVNGTPMAGAMVTVTLPSTTGMELTSLWTRSGTTATRDVATDGSGIADGSAGITLRTAPARQAVTAKAGTLAPVSVTIERYATPTRLTADTLPFNFAVVGTLLPPTAVTVTSASAIEWTIVPAANGAAATFAGGGTTFTSVPAAGTTASLRAPGLTANGMAGTYILRARAIGSSLERTFTFTNLAAMPATLSAAEPGPYFTLTAAAPPLRVIVRDAGGNPLAGVPVQFSVPVDNTTLADANWSVEPQRRTRTFLTDASGIATGGAGLTLPTPYTMSFTAAGVAMPGATIASVPLGWARFMPSLLMTPVGSPSMVVTPGVPFPAMQVRMRPAAPVLWTIVPAANGASGTFPGGATALLTAPGTPGRDIEQLLSATVTGNGIPGTFTVRATTPGGQARPVEFTLSSLAVLPVAAEKVGVAKPYSYSREAPPLRVRVKDAAGNPLAGIPVTFRVAANALAGTQWMDIDHLLVRTFITDADGIADGSPDVFTESRYRDTFYEAIVPGVAAPVQGFWVRYEELKDLDAIDGLVREGHPSQVHNLGIAASPAVPLRWTIIASSSGASATFAGGRTILETYPQTSIDTGDRQVTQTFLASVTANGVAGTFTVRVEAIDFEGPALIFSVASE